MIIQSPKFIKQPLVSVIILTYNQEDYIRQTINSILSQQSDFPFEVIIAEDYGSDSTRDICIAYQQKFPERIKLLLQELNQGLMRNYRDVLALCMGKYIAQCGGDDYWIDDYKLQKQINFLENNVNYGFIGTGAYELKKGKLFEVQYSCKKSGDIFQRALENTPIVACTLLFKKELLSHINFDTFINKKFNAEDYPLQVIFSKNALYGYLPDITGVYRYHDKSISHQKDLDQHHKYLVGLFEIRKYLKELYPEEYNLDITYWNNFIVYNEFKVAKSCFDYNRAKLLNSKYLGISKKSKKLKISTRNRFVFYISSLISLIANFKIK